MIRTPAQAAFGDCAPKLAELTDDMLSDDIGERPRRSKRDRSLIAVAALCRPNELELHPRRALDNGVAPEGETILHLAFRAGWPAATTATRAARAVLGTPPP